MSSHIHLIVSFHVQTISDDTYIPPECNITEEVALTFPTMESKFVVFPKLVEGATERVISQHAEKVASYLYKQADEKRKAEERKQLDLWNQANEGAGVEIDPAELEREPEAT